jgi:glycosyltransferase involved in cell wall biosynthesis
MKVCLLCYRGNPFVGGQGVYVHHLSRELARLGHEVHVIVGPPYPQPLEAWARVHRVPNLNLWGVYGRDCVPVRNPLALFRPWHLFDYAATRLRFFPEPLSFSFRALAVLARLARSIRFDVLHDVQSLGYGMLGMRAFGMPMLTTVHHPLSIDRREALARNRTLWERYHTAAFYPVAMQGVVIRRMHRVITASQAGKQAIAREFRVPEARISIVPNGLDTEGFSNPGRWPREPATLLFVGNSDDYRKGALTLLQALALLPAAVRLRIVDVGFPRHTRAPREAERLGLERRVVFTGRLSQERLREEYCRCTVLVQPSLFEGFGLPAAEALACQTPVVATRVGAVTEVVDEQTGRLVPPGDAPQLAQAIQALLDDPRLRERMGQAGVERMRAQFAWPMAAARTAQVYRQVLGSSGLGNSGLGSAVLGNAAP